MQPLTAAVPFKPEGAAHLGDCRPAVGTAGDSESALCPAFFSPRKHLKLRGTRGSLNAGGAPAGELLSRPGLNPGPGEILQSAAERRTKVPVRGFYLMNFCSVRREIKGPICRPSGVGGGHYRYQAEAEPLGPQALTYILVPVLAQVLVNRWPGAKPQVLFIFELTAGQIPPQVCQRDSGNKAGYQGN